MKLVKAVSVIILFLIFYQVPAQKKVDSFQRKIESLVPKKPIVCYSAIGDANTRISPPTRYLAWRKNQTARSKSASIIVTYEGFTEEAKVAFQTAVDIWETLITSSVPVHISASWRSLGTNVLGSASPGTYFRNFPGAQKLGVWYPISVAEKISRKELNAATEPDIVASFNSDNANWDFGTNGTPGEGRYDMVSVVLHEIGHGLGITHSYEVSGSNGQIQDFFDNSPVIFESFLENSVQANLVTGFSSPSTSLATQLTGQKLRLNSSLVLANNRGDRGIVYAPTPYSAGSSIAHLDENRYPKGDPNSLMTPFINSAEGILNPGPITMSILKDMGWNDVSIQHTPLTSTEDISNDFTVLSKIEADTIYDASSFKLFFTVDGINFISRSMTPTGNAKEFQTTIPKMNGTTTIGYFFSVTDNAQRTFVNPGKKYIQGKSTIEQSLFKFTTGPDVKPPHITHSPKGFIMNTDTQLTLEAIVHDNIGIKKVQVEFLINDIPYPLLTMSNIADSTYQTTLSLSSISLVHGDKIKYRITAMDNAMAQNVISAPSVGNYYTVNVVSLASARDSYANNFNSPTNDFFGDAQFGITNLTGFADGAIHSVHPYPNGSGPHFESNFVYQLRIPIKLKSTNAIIEFDDIALVEPSDEGSVFGSANFYDYVIVEGSKDGGMTWKPFADGYDSHSRARWETRWGSSSDNESQPNSTAIGDPSLFISQSIDMLANKNFLPGEEVIVRFRLFADQLVHGWGWAIDNLKIQIDDTAPTILHNHSDFILSTATNLNVTTKVTDVGGLKDLIIEYTIKNGALTNLPLAISPGTNDYTLNLSLIGSGLVAGDEIQYRIRATDKSNNTSMLPTTGFFHVPLLNFGSPLTKYVSDFNSINTDFTGNFFSIAKPDLFTDGAIHSSHPYLNGFGLDNTSSFQFMLKKPVIIDVANPSISFEEIVLTEFSSGSVKDIVVTEGSKDNGVTWHALLDSYTANAQVEWASAFTAKANGNPTMYRNRQFDITKNGNFKAGDAVLFRFRLMANATVNGWGWAIDNLSIQGPVTGLENTLERSFQIYPNPVTTNYFTIALPKKFEGAGISLLNLQGQSVINSIFQSSEQEQKIYVGDLANGLYLIKVNSEAGVLTGKIIIKR